MTHIELIFSDGVGWRAINAWDISKWKFPAFLLTHQWCKIFIDDSDKDFAFHFHIDTRSVFARTLRQPIKLYWERKWSPNIDNVRMWVPLFKQMIWYGKLQKNTLFGHMFCYVLSVFVLFARFLDIELIERKNGIRAACYGDRLKNFRG